MAAEPICRVWRHVYPERPLMLCCWLGRLESFGLKPDPVEAAEILRFTVHQALTIRTDCLIMIRLLRPSVPQ